MGKLMGTSELAKLLGISRQRAWQITGRADFPEPYDVLDMGKVWLTEDVRAWAQAHGREIDAAD